MKTTKHEVISSYYDDPNARPFWLPAGQVVVNVEDVPHWCEDLSHDESLRVYEITSYAEAAKHFGLTIRIYSEQEIANLLRSSNKAVEAACERMADTTAHFGVKIFQTAKYDGLKPEHMAEARAEALKHTAYLADLATYKAAQKQVDQARWEGIRSKMLAA